MMRYSKIIKLITISLLIVFLSVPSYAGTKRFYRYIDEDGVVRYTDVLPPKAVNKKRKVLNSRGLTVQKINRAKTREEKKKAKKLAQENAERVRLRKQQAVKDRILLRTYLREEDIIKARDEKILTINKSIEGIEENIERMNARMAKMNDTAMTYTSKNQEVPLSLKQQVELASNGIEELKLEIRKKELFKETTALRYEKDLKNFQDIKRRQAIEAEKEAEKNAEKEGSNKPDFSE